MDVWMRCAELGVEPSWRVVRLRALTRVDAERRSHDAATTAAKERGDVDVAVEFGVSSTAISLAIARSGMSPAERDVVRRRFYEGQTLREIATTTGMTLHRVRQYLDYALEKIRFQLKGVPRDER